jgi:hypothetical protein
MEYICRNGHSTKQSPCEWCGADAIEEKAQAKKYLLETLTMMDGSNGMRAQIYEVCEEDGKPTGITQISIKESKKHPWVTKFITPSKAEFLTLKEALESLKSKK